jgi:hypothetical protein
MSSPTPPLSVVIASTQPWPEVRGCLDALEPQAASLGAEIIVADSNGGGPPNSPHAYPSVRWLRLPGASPYRLRAEALLAARGEVVAVTEDHCRPRADWCRRVLESHREHADADVIGGAVENGATTRLIDWATFLVANGAFMQPLPRGERDAVSGQANVSYKRRILPDEFPGPGIVDAHFQHELRSRGARLFSDDRLVVDHVQSLGFAGTCVINFHNGRCTAGFERPSLTAGARAARLALLLFWPLRACRDTARILLRIWVRKGRHRAVALAATPLVTIVVCCHIAGEAVGYLTGPGDSPLHMR